MVNVLQEVGVAVTWKMRVAELVELLSFTHDALQSSPAMTSPPAQLSDALRLHRCGLVTTYASLP